MRNWNEGQDSSWCILIKRALLAVSHVRGEESKMQRDRKNGVPHNAKTGNENRKINGKGAGVNNSQEKLYKK